MAIELNELPPSRTATGRPAIYPWSDWLNGSPWRIAPSEVGDVRQFRSVAGQAAARRNLKIITRLVGDDVIIQAVPAV